MSRGPVSLSGLFLLSLAMAMFTVSCTVRLPLRPSSQTPQPTQVARPTPAVTATPSARELLPAEGIGQPTSGPNPPATPAVAAAGSTSGSRPVVLSPAGPPLSVVEVAARVRPAVAQILVRGTASSFFEPVPTDGEGSGVVKDGDGRVLTNNHVVEGGEEIVVSLPDREKTYTAKLVGRDPSTDLAVIQIEPDNLPVAQLGDSDALQVGEPVVAIGNALGLEGGPTVTTGVVSALSRSIDEPTSATLHLLIQTGAAIDPGNSGGALVNTAA